MGSHVTTEACRSVGRHLVAVIWRLCLSIMNNTIFHKTVFRVQCVSLYLEHLKVN